MRRVVRLPLDHTEPGDFSPRWLYRLRGRCDLPTASCLSADYCRWVDYLPQSSDQ
jgi:hypothetical protein